MPHALSTAPARTAPKSYWLVGLLCALWPGLAQPAPLGPPLDAHVTIERQETFASHAVPVGPWRGGLLPTQAAEGAVRQIAWRIEGPTTTLALLAPLRDQLRDAGFDILFECMTEACGGFDFRFAAEVLPEPEMHVDLSDFRFLSAQRPSTDGVETVSLLVSRSSARGFVQMTHVAPGRPEAVTSRVSTRGQSTELAPPDALSLDDLQFISGAAELAPGEYESVTRLAGMLRADPQLRATLVGHTDDQGSLQANLDLSRRRAAAVVDRLVRDHDIPRERLRAEGVGYLAPRASNATPEGRAQNRRVEALITAR